MLTALALVALFSPALIGEGIDPLLPFDGTGELDAPLVGEARARETKEQRRRHRCCRHLVAAELPPLGAKAAHSLPVKKLKRIFAMILYALAAYMLYKGLSS